MLAYFGSSWERFGIEPSAQAAALAAARGVSVLSARLEDAPTAEPFDVMVSIDVAEHINKPLPFFQAAASRLRPGGVFILVTGDTDAWTWRLEGSRYWYCSMVEHVSYYNDRSMNELARRSGMRSVEHVRTSHQRMGVGQKSLELFKNAAYIVGNRAGGFGLRSLRRLFMDRCGPIWTGMADHMIHVMQRV
jgi:SAM-dependent methyltransferase